MNTKQTLLLTIDFINELTHESGKLAHSVPFIKSHQTFAEANKVIAWARKAAMPIAHVKVGFSETYIECPLHSPVFGKAKEFKALQLGTWGTEFNTELAIQPGDKTIIKHRISAFYNTDLEAVLRANNIQTLLLCGVATQMAIELTAREAHDRDYSVIVIANACATATEELHQNALTNIGRIGQVMTAAELTVE